MPLQHANSYFTDAIASARKAETRAELEDLLAKSYKERVEEYRKALRSTALHCDGIENSSEQTANAVCRATECPSLETLVELVYAVFPDGKRRKEEIKKLDTVADKVENYEADSQAGTEQPGVTVRQVQAPTRSSQKDEKVKADGFDSIGGLSALQVLRDMAAQPVRLPRHNTRGF